LWITCWKKPWHVAENILKSAGFSASSTSMPKKQHTTYGVVDKVWTPYFCVSTVDIAFAWWLSLFLAGSSTTPRRDARKIAVLDRLGQVLPENCVTVPSQGVQA
jgi:hypothetical protein